MRDGIDVLRLTFLAAGIVLLVLGELGAGVRMLLTFGLVVLWRVLAPPRPFDLGFCLAMALQDVLDAFGSWSWYDKVVHVVLPFFAARCSTCCSCGSRPCRIWRSRRLGGAAMSASCWSRFGWTTTRSAPDHVIERRRSRE